MNNKSTIVQNAVIGNIIHIIFTIALVLITNKFKESAIIINITQVFILIIVLTNWFVIGWRTANLLKGDPIKNAALCGVLAIIPAGLYTILSQVLSMSINLKNVFQTWNAFYFIGGPTLFFQQPFAFIVKLMDFDNINTYVIFEINLLVIFFVVLLGGILINNKNDKVKYKKIRE